MKTLILSLILAASALAQQVITTTIAASGSLSAAVSVTGCTLAAIEMPVWTATNLTFQVSNDGITYTDFYDDFNTEVLVTTTHTTTARTIRLSAGDWWSVRYIKVRSGISATPVAQAAARTIKLICR